MADNEKDERVAVNVKIPKQVYLSARSLAREQGISFAAYLKNLLWREIASSAARK